MRGLAGKGLSGDLRNSTGNACDDFVQDLSEAAGLPVMETGPLWAGKRFYPRGNHGQY